ncbi:MAG TPA: response regulator [Candidatus Kapabacteria bacterium]|nr:response regulator [Candidatus Kapabacteria bacterium]
MEIKKMNDDFNILIVDDNEGHLRLIEKNLRRAGIQNRIFTFSDGQAILDFLFCSGKNENEKIEKNKGYLLLLDIRMPRVDGEEVLTKIKANTELRKIPVIMLTSMNAPEEVERCHLLGCNNYVPKPVSYDEFEKSMEYLGLFLSIIEVPTIK